MLQNNKKQELIHKLLPNSTYRFRPAKIASLWAVVMRCTRATWTKFVNIPELGLQCFFQNWSHTRLDHFCGNNWNNYQFWSGQYCWNRYQRQCSIQTCLSFFSSNLVVIILISSFLQIFLLYFSFDTHVGHSVSSVQGYFETTCSSSPKDEIRTVLVPCMGYGDLVHKVKEQVHSQWLVMYKAEVRPSSAKEINDTWTISMLVNFLWNRIVFELNST